MTTIVPLREVTGSSQVEAAGYHAETQTFAVRFKPPKNPAKPHVVYHYRGVPAEVAQAFDEAPSKGIFLAQHVRDKFEFETVPVAAEPAQA